MEIGADVWIRDNSGNEAWLPGIVVVKVRLCYSYQLHILHFFGRISLATMLLSPPNQSMGRSFPSSKLKCIHG